MKLLNFELRRLDFDDEEAFLVALKEWDSSPRFIFAPSYQPEMKFFEYVDLMNAQEAGEELPTGYVPHTSLFAFQKKEIVGRISIRHYLNDFLMNIGGHIGYGVIPRFRRKGFATRMLHEALPFAKELGLEKVLVTCDENNLASIKTIEANNGVLENKVDGGRDGVLKRRYWITLPNYKKEPGTL